MPLADRIYSPGRRRPLGSTNRSPLGGCWIEDLFFPTNWWLPAGTLSYYVAWVLNKDGWVMNYHPDGYIDPHDFITGHPPGSNQLGFNMLGAGAGLPGRTRIETFYVSSILQLTPYSKTGKAVPTTPGYDSTGPPINRTNVFGVADLFTNSVDIDGNPIVNGPNNVGSYSTNPTVIEYPVGTSLLRRYRGLQLFIQQTMDWIKLAQGSNPYRYFLNGISNIPHL
jgi:hypothetical protein